MDALLKMQSTPSADFSNQLDIIAKCITNKDATDELAVPPAKEFETRVQALIDRVNNSGGQKIQDAAERSEHRQTAEAFLELVKVTEQLSQIEKVAEQTRSCEAISTDAKKWQELTGVALDWSRKSFCQGQRNSIDKLSQLLKRDPDAIQGKATSEASQVDAVPKPAAPALPPGLTKETPSGFEQGETLRSHLETLAQEDPNRILIVRRINRLGFDSPLHLQNALSEFGAVTRVFVAHSRVKPSVKRPVPRVRPAGLGFVLMQNAQDAQRIASSGMQMMINNVNVEVQLYTPGSLGAASGMGDVEE